jgi:ubiquinone/menaquinone biosynthesis C-methylase UbiE
LEVAVLLPDELRVVWGRADAGEISREQASAEQERLLEGYAQRWRTALLIPGEPDLRTSLLREVGTHLGITDLAEVERRCGGAVEAMRSEWEGGVQPDRPGASIERFYQSATHIYDLMGWHSLRDDNGPLAYVLGLEIAQQNGATTCLDFGSGVGSGGLLFARAEFTVTLGDISETLLGFARWRFEQRGLAVSCLDLRTQAVPSNTFDIILAMDVFEHLTDPVQTVEDLERALRPGGHLFARIHEDDAVDHPQHIVRDFGPTFARMRELGLAEVWRDSWLWGHQLFRKG